MTPTDHDIAEVARKLTKAQREIVLRGDRKPAAAYAFRDDHDGLKASGDLRSCRLFERKEGGAQVLLWNLTPLGLRVKAYLQSKGGDA